MEGRVADVVVAIHRFRFKAAAELHGNEVVKRWDARGAALSRGDRQALQGRAGARLGTHMARSIWRLVQSESGGLEGMDDAEVGARPGSSARLARDRFVLAPTAMSATIGAMEIQIRNRPSFANLLVRLARGDRIITESDAMASMTSNIRLRTRWNGGFFSALMRRFLGGESLFINEFSAASEGQLVLTQPLPGDIECLDLRGGGLFLQPGAFLACEPSVALGLGYAGFSSLIAREGLFRLKVSGQGRVWFGGYGGIIAKDIQDEYIVDSGHLVAYEPSVSFRLAMAGSIFSSLFSGEGLVLRMRGPGRIYLQTRSMGGLAAWVNSHL